jgi:guanylate kinase
MMQNNEFFEVGRFGPGFYGTTYNSLDDLYNANVDIAILEADLETISFIKRLCQKPKSQILSVFLTPIESESFELDNVYIDRAISVLENRIISRCRGEEQRDIKGRLKGAKKMFLTMNQADYVIVNKDGSLEETLEQLYKIL